MQGKIGTASYINQALKDNDLFAKKKFGQNFLTDQNILSSIVKSSGIDKDTLVIEVGPGLGSLTEHLVKNASFVLAYEIDKDLVPLLEKTFSEYDNLAIINQDILDVDINNDIVIHQHNEKNVFLVANLPYYITTPIIEVAERICGKPKTKDYNALSIAIGYRCKATLEFKVPRTVFIPSPNVDSAVVKLDLYDNPPYKAKNEELFFEFIRDAFSQRRKTLYNNLGQKYKKEFISKMLEDLNIKQAVRAEELSIEDFVKMADYIEDNYD